MQIWPSDEEIQAIIEEDKQKEEEEKSNVVPLFRTITGGKTTGGNWLSNMKEGTIFISKPKGLDKPWLDEYKVNRKTQRTVQLISYPYVHMQHGLYLVDPIMFCRHNDLIEELGIEE